MKRLPLPLLSDPTISTIEKIDKVHDCFQDEITKFTIANGVRPDGLVIGADTFILLKNDPRFVHGVLSINVKEDSYMGIKVYGAINVPYDYIQCFTSETK